MINLRTELRDALGISYPQLNRLILRAPHTYKIYTIPKRTGGMRTIAQPAKETKFVQHWLIQHVFGKLPVHGCATAYQRNSSIRSNAEAHAKNSYIAKFDFRGFFPSIKVSALVAHFERHLEKILTLDDIRDVARVCCFKPESGGELCLSIGAPSSPLLSNSIMFEFDTAVATWAEDNGFAYTRYADDLIFSTEQKGICQQVEPALRRIVRSLEYPRLIFNNKKTVLVSKKHQRRVTGLILSSEGNVSLGRERKRMISALIHQYSLGRLTEDESYHLQGLLAFALDVEPLFVQRMAGKYGNVVSDILGLRKLA